MFSYRDPTKFPVINGPSREELFDAVRLVGEHRRLRFKTVVAENFPGADKTGEIEVITFGLHHNGGNRWLIFAGMENPCKDLLFNFSTEGRRGVVKVMDFGYWRNKIQSFGEPVESATSNFLSSLTPELVLCCEDCNSPLEKRANGMTGPPSGYYCPKCGLAPATQDVFARFQCTGCHCELETFITPNANQVGLFLRCTRCEQIYVRDLSPHPRD